jgi:hypothetical protein
MPDVIHADADEGLCHTSSLSENGPSFRNGNVDSNAMVIDQFSMPRAAH